MPFPFTPTLSEAHSKFNFHPLTTADGLTSNLVISLYQGGPGFVRIIADGLKRYDGQYIRQFYLGDFNSSINYNNFIGKIGEDLDHNILIAE